MSRRILNPRPLPGKNSRGRRSLPAEAEAEIQAAASEASQEMLPRLEEMMRDRILHVAEHIPESWIENGKVVTGEQEVVFETQNAPPFFTVTTRRVRE